LEEYLRQIFEAADRFVVIYASDFNKAINPVYQHEMRRSFTDFVNQNITGWKLQKIIKNRYPFEEFGEHGSLSDFLSIKINSGFFNLFLIA
jgi:hypothetical protein